MGPKEKHTHTHRRKKAEKICGQRFQRLSTESRKGVCGACAYWIIEHIA